MGLLLLKGARPFWAGSKQRWRIITLSKNWQEGQCTPLVGQLGDDKLGLWFKLYLMHIHHFINCDYLEQMWALNMHNSDDLNPSQWMHKNSKVVFFVFFFYCSPGNTFYLILCCFLLLSTFWWSSPWPWSLDTGVTFEKQTNQITLAAAKCFYWGVYFLLRCRYKDWTGSG